MPEATAISPAPAPVAAPSPEAGGLGNVPIGFSNIPNTPRFKEAAKSLRSGKYDAPSADDKKIAPKADGATEPLADKVEAVQTEQPIKEGEQKVEGEATKTVEGEKKKVSPWRLVDEWKEKFSRLEKELAEVKTKTPTNDPQVAEQIKTSNERISTLEKENGDLKHRLQFADYADSDDYKAKYEKPYHEAWQRGRAMAARMKLTDTEGNSRQATPQDFDSLMKSYLADPESTAQIIETQFGSRASLLTPYLVEVEKAQFQAQGALDEFKTKGVEERKQMAESFKRNQQQLSEHLTKTWEKANQSALTDPKNGTFFKPREGDQEWNQRLAKGFELVDRAFKENPNAPNLTPEQRESIVNRHAAVRNRAAAFGPMKHRIAQLESQLEEREKALAEYEDTVPGGGEGGPKNGQAAVGGGATALSRSQALLRSGKYSR